MIPAQFERSKAGMEIRSIDGAAPQPKAAPQAHMELPWSYCLTQAVVTRVPLHRPLSLRSCLRTRVPAQTKSATPAGEKFHARRGIRRVLKCISLVKPPVRSNTRSVNCKGPNYIENSATKTLTFS